jgi:L,D-transpeptidase ErfK/SrfK
MRRQPRLLMPLVAGLIAGCSLLNQPWRRQPPPPPPVPPLADLPHPVPMRPLPLDTHRFVLEGDTQDVVGVVQTTETSKEDTLPDIARRFDLGYEEMARANPGVDPWLPGAGRKVVVPTRFILPNAPRDGVVINLAAMRMYYYPKRKPGEKQLVYTHPIGVGRVGWNTPEGTTRIVSRERDPTWRPSAAVRKEHEENDDPVPAVVGPGPDNPLGKFKFNLGWPSYLMHGTNKPYGVGLRSSHGCIRLYPEDIAVMFDAIPIGTPVHVVNQPFLFGWSDEQLYMQAYTVLEDDKRWTAPGQQKFMAAMVPRLQKQLAASAQKVDWSAALSLAKEPRGVVVPISGDGSGLAAALGAAMLVQNRIPLGSNWDGADDAAHDEQEFKQVLTERERVPASMPAPAAAAAAGSEPPT